MERAKCKTSSRQPTMSTVPPEGLCHRLINEAPRGLRPEDKPTIITESILRSAARSLDIPPAYLSLRIHR